jgi:hypothetical protein
MNRQTRLVEVGREGQAKLEASTVVVHANDWIAARYLRGAGVRMLSEPEGPPIEGLDGFEDPSAREVARSAHYALVSIRRILGI